MKQKLQYLFLQDIETLVQIGSHYKTVDQTITLFLVKSPLFYLVTYFTSRVSESIFMTILLQIANLQQAQQLELLIIIKMQAAGVRAAKHAGSWYQKQKQNLNKTLSKYLDQTQCLVKNWKIIKAIIGPHAGYTYSGSTAAWAYRFLQQQNNKYGCSRIFLLGPSHKKYIKGCSLSGLTQLQTPLGNLKVDTEQISQLHKKMQFVKMTKKQQQSEHSLQMHMPFIYKVFGDKAKIIPIIVGENDNQMIQQYGKLFAPYFDRDDTIFIVSSDFCHWGDHFDYQPHQQGKPIWQFIKNLDEKAMKIIQNHDLKKFRKYMQQTGNTICGQQPIRLLMSTINNSKLGVKTQFVKYAQSEKVNSFDDSSVSYGSSISFVIQ